MTERPVPELVDHLFRREYSRLVAGLVRVLGPARIELAEDVVQDALHRALRSWTIAGVPEDPCAWLLTVARNRALDVVRRERVEREKEAAVARWHAERPTRVEEEEDALLLLAACCHPALPLEARVALTLKTACGFGVREIARALDVREDAVAQRLLRARKRLSEVEAARAPREAVVDPERRSALLEVLYLLFNEGYSATSGAVHVRADMMDEALRLGRILHARIEGSAPELDALLALQLFQSARIPARIDGNGAVVPLARQDRGLWDRARLAEAWARFERSCEGDAITSYHVEAAIAAAHAAAPTYETTDWRAILEQYDVLLRIAPSPIVEQNRVVAIAKVHGVERGLAELDELARRAPLDGRLAIHAARGMFSWHAGKTHLAREAFLRALDVEGNAPERALLARRLEKLDRGEAPEPF